MRVVWVRFNRKEKFVLLAIAAAIVIGGGVAGALILGGVPTQSSSSSIDLQNGLIGWWKMLGNAKDSTPYGDNGTVNGATLTTDRKGQANSAYSFNGTSNYIQTPNTSPLNTVSSLSISAWIYPTSYSSTGYGGVNGATIIGSNTTGGTNGWILGIQSSGSKLWWWPAGSQDRYSAGTIPLNQWTHVVLTFSSGTLDIYLNGTLDSSQSAVTPQVPTTSLEIGAKSWITGWFAGSMDDLRIWNRALSANEVTALYKEYDPGLGLSSGENGLVGWWKMDGNAKDSTPNANNGTVTSATLTTDREGAANSAYSFNGTSSYISTATFNNLPSSTMTICSWIETSSSSSQVIMEQGRSPTDADTEYQFEIISNKLYFWDYTAGYGFNAGAGSTVVTDGKWHLVCFVKNATAGAFYVDGATDGTITAALNATYSSNDFVIGADYRNASEYFNGSMDDVRVYNQALSAAQIATLYKEYNSQVAVSSLQSGEIGDWPLNGNAKDNTPYGDNGTVSGASLTTDREGRGNSAYSFTAGSSQYISLPNGLIQPNDATISVSAWFETSSSGTAQAIFGYQNAAVGTTPSNYVPLLYVGADGKLRGEFYQGGTSPITSTGTVNNGSWHLVVITGNTSTQSLYLDGSLVGTLSGTINTSLAMTKNQIGTAYGASWPSASGWIYFNGSIDDVRIWNRALSAAEVTALYKEYQ